MCSCVELKICVTCCSGCLSHPSHPTPARTYSNSSRYSNKIPNTFYDGSSLNDLPLSLTHTYEAKRITNTHIFSKVNQIKSPQNSRFSHSHPRRQRRQQSAINCTKTAGLQPKYSVIYLAESTHEKDQLQGIKTGLTDEGSWLTS